MKHDRKSRSDIEALVFKYRQSGLPVKVFVAENRLVCSTFYTYLKKYQNRKKLEKFAKQKTLPKSVSQFLPVAIAPKQTSHEFRELKNAECIKAKKGNWEFLIPVGTNPAWLASMFGGSQ
jgi:hypothetical protein